ncbi:MAG: nitrate- and nitrite sensing domain-containing protein [Perlucidibaca sp.]
MMTESRLPTALNFLIAARRSELVSLERLAETCELVMLVGSLVHALQRERGYTNMHLGGRREETLPNLQVYSAESEKWQAEVCRWLEPLQHEAGERMRLLDRIAHALHGLDELPSLRRRIRERHVDDVAATAAFTRLIGILLNVVFEAADTAADPDLARMLVALFNFMQGKELAGQERALGVLAWSAGCLEAEQATQLTRLIEHQQRCFETFERYAAAAHLTQWHAQGDLLVPVSRLRELVRRITPEQSGTELAEAWFAVCTARIDAMRELEMALALTLQQQCRQQVGRAGSALENHRMLARQLGEQGAQADQPLWFSVREHVMELHESPVPGQEMDRAILTLLQTREQRLLQLSDELREARQSLAERRRLEQAKQLRMQHQQLSEQEAWDRLRRAAMARRVRLIDVADQLLSCLPGGG